MFLCQWHPQKRARRREEAVWLFHLSISLLKFQRHLQKSLLKVIPALCWQWKQSKNFYTFPFFWKTSRLKIVSNENQWFHTAQTSPLLIWNLTDSMNLDQFAGLHYHLPHMGFIEEKFTLGMVWPGISWLEQQLVEAFSFPTCHPSLRYQTQLPDHIKTKKTNLNLSFRNCLINSHSYRHATPLIRI